MGTQPDKRSESQSFGALLGGGATTTNGLLLILIVALFVDIYIRLSPARDTAPELGTLTPDIAPAPPGRRQGSSYARNHANQAIIKSSSGNLYPSPGGKPKVIVDRILPSP